MSRNLVILLVVMCAAVAGLIIYPKLRSQPNQQTAAVTPDPGATPTPAHVPPVPPVRTTPETVPQPVVPVPPVNPGIGKTTVAVRTTTPTTLITNAVPENDLDTKPLPVL